MSRRKDRERAGNGQLFRNGEYVPKEKLIQDAKEATDKALAEAEEAHGELAAVTRWLKKASEERALMGIVGNNIRR